jgi:hypothetical protein
MSAIRIAITACTLSFAALALPVQADVGKVAWLAGCWKNASGEPGSIEQWLPPAGGNLLGVSRTVRQGKTVTYEFMRIASEPGGVLAFHAQPSGQAATTFLAVKLTDTEVVFENLQHDFPQRVIYAADGPERLNARIEGTRNGKPRAIHFPMVRVSCDALLKEAASVAAP